MKLYDIQSEYAAIIAAIEENGGELTPEINEALTFNGADFDAKIENYIKAIRNADADAEAYKAEAAAFKAKADRAANTSATLKATVLAALRSREIDKQQFGLFKASVRRSEKVLVAEDMIPALPDQYKRVKTTVEADKTAIKEALKAGETIDGAEIIDNYSLQIK